jgi:hypothetical protein
MKRSLRTRRDKTRPEHSRQNKQLFRVKHLAAGEVKEYKIGEGDSRDGQDGETGEAEGDCLPSGLSWLR